MFRRHYGCENVLTMSSNLLFCTQFGGVCGVMANITFRTHMGAFSKRGKPVVSEVFGGAKVVLDACPLLRVCPRGAPPLHTTPHLELKLPYKLHSLKGSFRHLVFARERKERVRLIGCEHAEPRYTHVRSLKRG